MFKPGGRVGGRVFYSRFGAVIAGAPSSIRQASMLITWMLGTSSVFSAVC